MRPALLVLPLLIACEARLGPAKGGSDGADTRPDARAVVDAAGQHLDASMSADNECGIAMNQGDLGVMTGTAGAQPQGDTTAQTYFVVAPTSLTVTQQIPDILYVELWDGYGAFANGTAHTGTFTISGDETDYDTCGVCVLMGANFANNTPAKLLLANTGTVTVTSIATAPGETTEVEITNASFVEIEYDPDRGYETESSSCASPIMHGVLRGAR